ncbi:glyoxylase-like metal-dependent hydrolase (beta-lactamase superfamily II) [Crossiella equi]|uniref:Glyoxylase-like metal-dependent hydrolase (Beta-lactamase superfamily II) n=1 Tax=Crossiella equi TaxID=130796 RepID=A0ABS5A4G1_9PSEU|nr:MBL fold metallo-hydrolase [Crossiella equi]MBP2471464.1 glyoxylase-like metal-dependent hydrolase (beta-lactamase superfamily II) [Crossiella equi]
MEPWTEVAENVFAVTGTDVNFLVVREGTDLTLVDTGWAGDKDLVEHAIRGLGHKPQDVRAVLLTHAHLDHVGALNHLRARYGIPVYTHPAEVPHAHREFLQQASPLDIISRAWRPSVLTWALRIVRAGALKEVEVPHAQAFPTEGALDLPGHPVPVPTPGHTAGHSAYLFPGAGVLATGDALVTAHPTSRVRGPQLLPGFFTHDAAGAVSALEAIGAAEADVLVPGHGPVWRGEMAEAAKLARERAGSSH